MSASERGHCGAPVKGRGLAWSGERYDSGLWNTPNFLSFPPPESSNVRSIGLARPNFLQTFGSTIVQYTVTVTWRPLTRPRFQSGFSKHGRHSAPMTGNSPTTGRFLAIRKRRSEKPGHRFLGTCRGSLLHQDNNTSQN